MKRAKKTCRSHADFSAVIDYIKFGKYPKNISDGEKRTLRKRSKSFRVEGNDLYYVVNPSSSKYDGVSDKQDRLVLLKEEERYEAVAAAHIDERGVHLGREKATANISKKYYWVGVSNMVRDYARSCSVCQANRIAQNQAYTQYRQPSVCINKDEEEFHDVEAGSSMSSSFVSTNSDQADQENVKTEWPVMSEPISFGEVVEVSVLGPYKTKKSNQYVVVFMDVFSGWPEVYLLDKINPSDMTHLVMKWICRFGSMENLVMKECGPCKPNQCLPLNSLLKSTGMLDISVLQETSDWNTSLHWQQVKESITSFIGNNKDWNECLDFALLPVRISRAKEADYTPSYIVYRREFHLPPSLSHQEKSGYNSQMVDPHLTLDQMKSSTQILVNVFEEYSPGMGREFQEIQPEVVEEENFKVPTKRAGRKRGRKKDSGKGNAKVPLEDDGDEDDDGGDDIIDFDDSDDYEVSRSSRPSASKKLKDSSHNSIPQTEEEAEVEDGDSFIEKADQERCGLDNFYKGIMTYVRDKTYPPGCGEHMKRAIRKVHRSYSLQDGALMYKTGSNGIKKVITTLRERIALLKSAHIDSEGSHLSVRQMSKELVPCYWRTIVSDCQAFAAACPDCEVGSTGRSRRASEAFKMATIHKLEKAAEMAEKYYSLLMSYLQKNKFPPSSNEKEKSAVVEMAKQFKLDKGVLYLSDNSEPLCVEIASRARKMAVKSAHTSTGIAVPTVEELCSELSQKYIWHGLVDDVRNYLSTLGTSTQDNQQLKLPHVEKKRLEFIKYFENEEEFFMNYEKSSMNETSNVHSKEKNIQKEKTPVKKEQNKKFSAVIPENTSSSSDKEVSESQFTEETGTETEEQRKDPKEDFNDYLKTSSNKVYLVSTSRNPTEKETSITVHIEEMEKTNDTNSDNVTENTEENEKTSSEKNVKSPKVQKNQFSDLGEGGLVHLANALALVSDPLTEAAVQSIITGPVSSTSKDHVDSIHSEQVTALKSRVKGEPIAHRGVIPKTVQSVIQQETVPSEQEKVDQPEEGKDVELPYKKKKGCMYVCGICDKAVRGDVKFKIHMYKHNGVKPFPCEKCNKKFTNTKSRRLHMRKHTGETPYLCSLCGKNFSLIGSLKAHIKIHEKGGNVKMECQPCKRVFASRNRYERHMQYKHPSTPPVYKCESCNKYFTTARSLKRHTMSFHLNIKYHLCGVCGKSFFRKEYLTSHLIQHGAAPVQSKRVRKASQKQETAKAESTEAVEHVVQIQHIGPSVQHAASTGVQQLDHSGVQVHHIDTAGLQQTGHAELRQIIQADQTDVQQVGHSEIQHIEHSEVQHIDSSRVQHIARRTSHDNLEAFQSPHIVRRSDLSAEPNVPVTLYSSSPVQVENTFYAIENSTTEDDQQVAHTVVYGYPAVQYEVECSSGADQLDSEALSAINLLAQASASQGNESITYVAHTYQ